LLRTAANDGNAEACYGLGQIYKRGLGVSQDYKEIARNSVES